MPAVHTRAQLGSDNHSQTAAFQRGQAAQVQDDTPCLDLDRFELCLEVVDGEHVERPEQAEQGDSIFLPGFDPKPMRRGLELHGSLRSSAPARSGQPESERCGERLTGVSPTIRSLAPCVRAEVSDTRSPSTLSEYAGYSPPLGSQCPSSASRAACLAGWAVRGLECPAPKSNAQSARSWRWRSPTRSCMSCATTPAAAPPRRAPTSLTIWSPA